jgi:hypothetical protein
VRADPVSKSAGTLASHHLRWRAIDPISEVSMSFTTLVPHTLTRFHWTVIASWLVVVAISMLARVRLSAFPVSLIESLGWLMLACVPVIVVFSVFRGAPKTMAQMLYDTDHSTNPAPAVAKARK